VRLGRKEGIEDAVNMSLVDPASGILDREAHACLFVGRCLDRQQALACPVTALIASAAFMIRLSSTCCNGTRSPVIFGRA